MWYVTDQDREMIEQNTDEYGDSYCQDVTVDQLKEACVIIWPREQN